MAKQRQFLFKNIELNVKSWLKNNVEHFLFDSNTKHFRFKNIVQVSIEVLDLDFDKQTYEE